MLQLVQCAALAPSLLMKLPQDVPRALQDPPQITRLVQLHVIYVSLALSLLIQVPPIAHCVPLVLLLVLKQAQQNVVCAARAHSQEKQAQRYVTTAPQAHSPLLTAPPPAHSARKAPTPLQPPSCAIFVGREVFQRRTGLLIVPCVRQGFLLRG